jgi:hypothetical protein
MPDVAGLAAHVIHFVLTDNLLGGLGRLLVSHVKRGPAPTGVWTSFDTWICPDNRRTGLLCGGGKRPREELLRISANATNSRMQ